jgi:hypothetical protein
MGVHAGRGGDGVEARLQARGDGGEEYAQAGLGRREGLQDLQAGEECVVVADFMMDPSFCFCVFNQYCDTVVPGFLVLDILVLDTPGFLVLDILVLDTVMGASFCDSVSTCTGWAVRRGRPGGPARKAGRYVLLLQKP